MLALIVVSLMLTRDMNVSIESAESAWGVSNSSRLPTLVNIGFVSIVLFIGG